MLINYSRLWLLFTLLTNGPHQILKLPNYCVSKPFRKTDRPTRHTQKPPGTCLLAAASFQIFLYWITLSPWGTDCKLARFSQSQQPLVTVSDSMHVKYTFTGRPKSRGRHSGLSSVICLARWHLGHSSHLSVFFSGASNKINWRCLGILAGSQNTKELDSYDQAFDFSTKLDTRLANQVLCNQPCFILCA